MSKSLPYSLDHLSQISRAVETLTSRISPAVVQVLSTGFETSGSRSNTSSLLTKRHSVGAGVIVDPSGYIITNRHVIQGATRVQVGLTMLQGNQESTDSILKPRRKIVNAEVLRTDAETDLAVLQYLAFERE